MKVALNNKRIRNNQRRFIQIIHKFLLKSRNLWLFLSISFLAYTSAASSDENEKLPGIQIRMVRSYAGGVENKPPIIIISSGQDQEYNPPVGERDITFEFDIVSTVPPVLFARFFHCSADWSEDENVFLNDITLLRTSNIQWESSAASARFYNFRGRITVPNEQVKFAFSGNWKMKLYEYGNDTNILSESRFFVVQPSTECIIQMFGDFYNPKIQTSPSAVTVEAMVRGSQKIFENQLNTVVFYRNNRWLEPYFATTNDLLNKGMEQYRYKYKNSIGGFISMGKYFRVERLPVENYYRILNLADLTFFPAISAPVRTPFSDLRRLGTFWDYDDDGYMITRFVSPGYDDYVLVEFLMDSEGWISDNEVFVSGSFNNWMPDDSWQMYYDEEDRYYKLRQLVRRGRHNYMYATGKYNIDTRKVEKIAYDEFEGNASSTNHTFIAFVYYRSFEYGGYDAIYGVGASTAHSSIRK